MAVRASEFVSRQAPARLLSLDSRRFDDRPPFVDFGLVESAYFGSTLGWIETPVIGRGDLSASVAHGPLLIDEYDSTAVIPPRCTARLDSLANIRINIQGVS